MKKEIWKDVIGWEGLYIVSNFGKICSCDRVVSGNSSHLKGRKIKGKLRKLLIMTDRYVSVNLEDKKSKKSTRNSVHRFVAQSFIPNPENKPCINHKDGNKQNNHVSNLEWCTYKENSFHAVSTGLLKPRKLTEEHKARLRELHIGAESLREWKKNNKHVLIKRALAASMLQVKKVNQFDKNGIFIKQWNSIAEASRATGASQTTICRCTKGKLKTSGGFKWELPS